MPPLLRHKQNITRFKNYLQGKITLLTLTPAASTFPSFVLYRHWTQMGCISNKEANNDSVKTSSPIS